MVGVAVLGLAVSVSVAAHAQLVNGSFEMNGGNGQLGFNTSVTGWSVPAPSGSYTFLFGPGTADTSGANGQYGGLALWGPNNGSANGLPATSPDGGYFIAQDSDFQTGALTQTVNNLTVGHTYDVSFDWAAAQQYGFDGANQSGWYVSLGGGPAQDTGLASIPNHGFSGWMTASFNYTATSTSEVLSFMAHGSPQVPPFALLDGVKMTDTSSVPEPTAVVSIFAGVMGFGVFARRRRRAVKSIA
jgi:hypothetical protein